MDGPPPSSDDRHEEQPPRSNALNVHSVPDMGNVTNTAFPYLQGLHGAPPQVPPETYNHLINALLSLQGSASFTYPQNCSGTYPYPAQPGPLLPYNYRWPAGPVPSSSMASSRSMYPSGMTPSLPPGAVSQSVMDPSQITPSSSTTPQTPPTIHDTEQTDEMISISEDKRRRNTAASARFRIKKKMKTLNLERTVADLTGRTEELEREATDLRRENAWLKEIVVLKGRSLAGLNLSSQSAGATSGHEEDEANRSAESESESREKYEEKDKNRSEEEEGTISGG